VGLWDKNNMATGLFFLAMIALSIGLFGLHLYGAYLGFQKKWYIGLAALLVGGFGVIIGAAKLFFNKDLIKV
jgi:hypothetical protein